MSTLKTDTLSNTAGSKSVPMNTVVDGSAKAWVNFNGTGTVAIRAAFNVSSITDNGTGDYTLNFTGALPDANYSIAGVSSTGAIVRNVFNVNTSGQLAGSCRVGNVDGGSGALADAALVCVSIFR